jgi:hypothetical protein
MGWDTVGEVGIPFPFGRLEVEPGATLVPLDVRSRVYRMTGQRRVPLTMQILKPRQGSAPQLSRPHTPLPSCTCTLLQAPVRPTSQTNVRDEMEMGNCQRIKG